MVKQLTTAMIQNSGSSLFFQNKLTVIVKFTWNLQSSSEGEKFLW